LTKDKVAEMDDATYSAANKAISASVRAALDTIGATGVFVASSGSARSAEDPTASHDMQLYGSLKKYEEDIFSQWTTDTGKLAIITRIFNVTGPYMNKLQSYAYSSFILDALANRPISVRAPHRVIRGYVAIKELMSLVFAILLDGKPDVFRFDTGGPPQELEEVAHSVSHALGSVPVMRAEIQSDATDHYVGDKQRYDTLLTQYSIHSVSAEEGIRDTAEFLIATQ
jgi:nucleoside-diphosphate-sugar epimerase